MLTGQGGAIRFSQDSRKFAINSHVDQCLEIWHIEHRNWVLVYENMLRVSCHSCQRSGQCETEPSLPISKLASIATWSSTWMTTSKSRPLRSTSSTHQRRRLSKLLFEGHTNQINGLLVALSFDWTLLVSAVFDNAIKFCMFWLGWAYTLSQMLTLWFSQRFHWVFQSSAPLSTHTLPSLQSGITILLLFTVSLRQHLSLPRH